MSLALFMIGCSYLGTTGFIAVVCCCLFLFHKATAYFVLKNLSLGFFISTIMKQYIPSPRPYILDPNIVPIIRMPSFHDYTSFPSGHVVVVSSVCLSLMYVYRKNAKFCYLLLLPILLVAVSRVYLGCHFILDTVVAVIVSVVVLFVIIYCDSRCML